MFKKSLINAEISHFKSTVHFIIERNIGTDFGWNIKPESFGKILVIIKNLKLKLIKPNAFKNIEN